ncbi:hypothetical protein BJX70DRAFT_326655 [Aspergillus crustosus]
MGFRLVIAHIPATFCSMCLLTASARRRCCSDLRPSWTMSSRVSTEHLQPEHGKGSHFLLCLRYTSNKCWDRVVASRCPAMQEAPGWTRRLKRVLEGKGIAAAHDHDQPMHRLWLEAVSWWSFSLL